MGGIIGIEELFVVTAPLPVVEAKKRQGKKGQALHSKAEQQQVEQGQRSELLRQGIAEPVQQEDHRDAIEPVIGSQQKGSTAHRQQTGPSSGAAALQKAQRHQAQRQGEIDILAGPVDPAIEGQVKGQFGNQGKADQAEQVFLGVAGVPQPFSDEEAEDRHRQAADHAQQRQPGKENAADVEQLRMDLQQARKELSQAKDKETEIASQLEAARQDLMQREDKNSQLLKQIKDLEIQLSEAQNGLKVVDEVEIKLQQFEQIKASKDEKIAQLLDNLQSVEEENKQLQARLNDLIEQKEKLEQAGSEMAERRRKRKSRTICLRHKCR